MSDQPRQWEGWVKGTFAVEGDTREEALRHLLEMLRENLELRNLDVCSLDEEDDQ